LATANEARATPYQHWYSVVWENDFIADDDSGYTNGLAFSWGKAPFKRNEHPHLSAMFSYLPGFDRSDQTYSLSWRIAQGMFTPDNIEIEELQPNDRPYAGLLLASAHLQAFTETVSIRYSTTLGVVGPASGAEPVQKFIHELIGTNSPNGWDHQLENEPVFMFSAERLDRWHQGQLQSGLQWDFIGLSAADLGVLHSEVGAGIGLRIGHALDSSFRAASLIPGRNLNPLAGSLQSEWHLYLNLYGRYVFNDLATEGNWTQDSHGVTLTHEQLLYSVGGAYNKQSWGLACSIQQSSRTFEERRENTLFATFAWTWRY
jgi:hypothetical protein